MEYRRLGHSNLCVPSLCLGAMMFGEQTPLDAAVVIVASARDHNHCSRHDFTDPDYLVRERP